MKQIKKLPKNVINKIAAGEVIERPVSIVKELIENSIDAKSDKINIEIINGGIDLIKIEDNGQGINKTDLKKAIELHTTSKLKEIEELEIITSLGFRGEALASIASVTDMEIISNSDTNAYKLTQSEKIEPTSREKGTTIIVKNLFRKIPARRKFLKTPNTEAKKIKDQIKLFAINFPYIDFSLTNNQKQIYFFQKTNFKNRLIEIYKYNEDELINLNKKIIINNKNSKNSKDSKILIQGYLCHPKTAKKQANQFISINQRIIKSPLISSAIKKAYYTKIPNDIKPEFFLKFQISGKYIDINVHPRKEEIKFSNEGELYKRILKLTQNTLNNYLNKELKNKIYNFKPKNKIIEKQTSKPTKFNLKNYNYNSNSHNSTKQSLDFTKMLLKDSNSGFEYKSSSSQFFGYSNFQQVFNTYIILEKKEKLLIIDQHAADERINYEKFKTMYKNKKIDRTPLLIAQIIELKNINIKYKKLEQTLLKLGFKIDLFGIKQEDNIKIKIEEIPTLFSNTSNIKEMFNKIFNDFNEEINIDKIEENIDTAIATIACHGSIRAGEKLSQEKIQKLINDLLSLNESYSCPHGRPIIWELKKQEIEKQFKRR